MICLLKKKSVGSMDMLIKNAVVKCLQDQCGWTGSIVDYQQVCEKVFFFIFFSNLKNYYCFDILKNYSFIFFQYHERNCRFILINCRNDNCEMKIQRGLMESHATERCVFRSSPCEHCEEIIAHKDLEV